MTTTIRICVLSLAIATTAWAQDDGLSADSPSVDNQSNNWRESATARCAQQYSAEQCSDSEFLEENFHIDTLEIAHRAAIRRNQAAAKAMREVILQHACNDSPSKICEGNESTQCVAEVSKTCAKLKAEASACIQYAKQGCVSTANPTSCFQQKIAQCPSEKTLPLAQLLAKYPQLSAAQKSHLISTAQTLDAKTRGWWSNLVGWTAAVFN